jgi:type I restriction enzyme R subunit/putative DNA methylase
VIDPINAALGCGDFVDKSEDIPSGERHPQKHIQQHRGWYSRGYLPHFDSPYVIQHITYRLADSLPRAVLEQIQTELRTSIQDEDQRQTALRQRVETYLDAGNGSCVLQEPEVAACVVDTWHRFDGKRYHLLEWVVMPNHCHVLIEPFEGTPLGKIVLSWKNYTARFINEYKSRTGVRLSQDDRTRVRLSQDDRARVRPIQDDRTGVRPTPNGSQVWQREYWDRFIRDEHHFEAVKKYIIMNPVQAGLAAKPEDWPWSSAKDRIEQNGTR